MDDKTRAYTIKLIEIIDGVLESLDFGSSYWDSPVGKKLDINLNKDFNRYWEYLNQLYDMLDAEGLITDDLLDEFFYLKEISIERSDEIADAAHEEIMYSVEEGDKVRLSNGNVFYVVSIDGNSLWVSKKPGGPEGWHADLYDVEEILEKNSEW